MFGSERSCKVLLDEISSSSFLPYNQGAVKKVRDNVSSIERQINQIKETVGDGDIPEEVSINYIMLTFYKSRCLRILKTYHLRRLLGFDGSYDLLTREEGKTLKEMEKLQENYLKRFNLNFQGSVPLFSYVKIITEKDCGLVYDGEELIELKKGRIYFVRRKTVEHLLEGGYIKIMQE